MRVSASNAPGPLGALDRAIAIAKGSIEDMQGLATPQTIAQGQRDLQWLCEAFDILQAVNNPLTLDILQGHVICKDDACCVPKCAHAKKLASLISKAARRTE